MPDINALAALMQQVGSPGAPQAPGGAPPQMQAPQQQAPAITKQQLTSGLHHFGGITAQLRKVAGLPELGKDNVRAKINDVAAQLLIDRIMTLPEVMNVLKTLPTEPPQQKNWVMQHLQGAEQAQKKIVEDYVSQGPTPEGVPEVDDTPWSADGHSGHMSSLLGQYKR